MKSDIEIARSVKMRRITEIASDLGIPEESVEQYGHYMAKIPSSLIDPEKIAKSKLVLVTAITTTKAEVGHRSTSACSLGQMCMELGRGKSSFSLKWDAAKETTGDAAADALMKPFARDKYDLKVNLKEFGLDFDEVMKG